MQVYITSFVHSRYRHASTGTEDFSNIFEDLQLLRDFPAESVGVLEMVRSLLKSAR